MNYKIPTFYIKNKIIYIYKGNNVKIILKIIGHN